MTSQKPTFASVVSNSRFRFLWLNQVLMQLAINILNFTLIIWVFKLTDSNLAVSALILSYYLPALLFGIFAGVFVDLLDRRKIIIFIDLLLAVAFLLLAFIKSSYPLILVDAFFINALTQFFIPAESSSIPMLVARKELFLANALFSFTLYGSFMIGFILAGPVLTLFGINTVFYLGAAALMIAFYISQHLPSLKLKRVSRKAYHLVSLKKFEGILSLTVAETKETLRLIKGKLNILTAIGLLSAIQGVIGILAVVVSPYMERVLRIRATDASLVLMLPLGLGMVLGALLIGRSFHGIPRRFLVIPAIISSGMLLFMVGIAPTLARFFNAIELPEHIPHLRYFFNAPSLSSTFAIGAFLLGVCAVAIIIPSQTILQENTRASFRGKIFAVLVVLMNAFAVLPVLLAGVLSDLFGVVPVFIGLGALIFVIGLLALKPSFFFTRQNLPFTIREFLGLGHWENQ